MDIRLDNLIQSLLSGLKYLPATAKLVFFSFLFGALLGLLIALVRTYQVRFWGKFLAVAVTIYRGLPTMVALLLFNLLFILKFDDIAGFLHLDLRVADVDRIVVGYFTISLFAAASISETFRGALKGIPREQYEAGYSVGLTERQTLWRIILPQMLPIAIPGLINNMVGIIKGTALVFAIGIVEVMAGAIIPCGLTYSFTEGYLAAAIIYWVFSIVVEQLARIAEVRLTRHRKKIA